MIRIWDENVRSKANPVIAREELFISIDSPLQSVYVKRHRALPMKLASVFHKCVSFSIRVLGLNKESHPKMSWRSTGRSRST
ncbi:hypothetical protein TNCV_2302351 [Trichonephila clavipes]|nr:hypothetical protein TNCV_2302351 [Trichonephila clavipes]